MDKNKMTYERPTSNILVIRFGRNLCGSFTPQGTEKGNNRNDEGDEYFFE